MSDKHFKILLCDDSMFARKKLRMFISGVQEFSEIDIYEAADGEEAVSKYKEFTPDLVFMDIVMPKLTGIEALRQIMDVNPEAIVVMASSVGTQSQLKEAINIGAFNFLQKPIDNDEVKVIIESIID